MGDGEVNRPMTFGEKSVGLTFNPSGDEKVNKVKELYAGIIDLCDELRKENKVTESTDAFDAERLNEKGRFLSIAITEAQTAQMWAVKGITK